MTNLTISLDEAIVKSARIRALQEGTSVSAKIREFLTQYVQAAEPAEKPGMAFVRAARASTYNTDGVKWNREALYDRPFPGKYSQVVVEPNA